MGGHHRWCRNFLYCGFYPFPSTFLGFSAVTKIHVQLHWWEFHFLTPFANQSHKEPVGRLHLFLLYWKVAVYLACSHLLRSLAEHFPPTLPQYIVVILSPSISCLGKYEVFCFCINFFPVLGNIYFISLDIILIYPWPHFFEVSHTALLKMSDYASLEVFWLSGGGWLWAGWSLIVTQCQPSDSWDGGTCWEHIGRSIGVQNGKYQ